MIRNMQYRGLVSIIQLLFYAVSETVEIQYLFDELTVPCTFWDTINITDGYRLNNGSFYHNGIVYPKEYYGIYNYQFANLTIKESVEPHLRGCICSIKPCIRLCCPIDQAFNVITKECIYSQNNSTTIVNVTNSKGLIEPTKMEKKFSFVYGRPCLKMYDLDPGLDVDDSWELFENGTVLRSFDQAYLSKNEYCFSLTLSRSPNSSELALNPFMCYPNRENVRDLIYGFAMLTSIPFLVITIAIYMIIPELRNLHGKALCCYLSGLVVGYACLGVTLVEGGIQVNDSRCEIFGYSAYFSFMSSFLWLSVISFDLWWNFRNMSIRGSKKEMKRFIIYSVYSWGLALIFTIAIFLIQKSDIPNEMKPGIGVSLCWLESKSWMQLCYFYGHIIIIITFNITMFVLTTYKIHRITKETSKMMGREDSRRNINREKDNVGLFLRLFIVMGVTWSMDIVSWLFGKDFDYLFYITDICNAIQGFIIFVLFVMKNKVKRLIIKRYNSIRGIQERDTRISQYSTKTSTLIMTTPSSATHDKTEISLMPSTSVDSHNGYSKNG